MTDVVLEHHTARRGRQVTLRLRGEIDRASSPQLAAALHWCLESHPDAVTVNLQGATFCDCAGLNVLLAARQRAADEGATLTVTAVHAPMVKRLFDCTGAAGTLGVTHASGPGSAVCGRVVSPRTVGRSWLPR